LSKNKNNFEIFQHWGDTGIKLFIFYEGAVNKTQILNWGQYCKTLFRGMCS